MVAQNLVKQMGLHLERDQTKTLEAVDGGVVECHGLIIVKIPY